MSVTKKAPAKAAKKAASVTKKPAGYKSYSHSPGQDEDIKDASESLSGKSAPEAVTGKKAKKKAKALKEKKPRAESAQGSVIAMLAAGATDEEIVAKLGNTFGDKKVPLAVKITRIRSRINRGVIKADGIKIPLERKMRDDKGELVEYVRPSKAVAKPKAKITWKKAVDALPEK